MSTPTDRTIVARAQSPDRSTAPQGSPSKPTVKQQREQRRQAKVEAFKKEQERTKRNRRIAITLSSVGAVAVVALITTIVIGSIVPKRDPADIDIAGLKTWDSPGAIHVDPQPVDYEADYGMNPPAGGAHWSGWLNCGIYTEPQENERAVHALEHGAVWVTYDADNLSEREVQSLRDSLPNRYVVMSPYEGLDAPVVVSAWGAQVKLDGPDDERLKDFIEKYWQSPDVPEPGGFCTGSVDGPGKIA